VIDDTNVNDKSSAIEAICVSPAGDPRLQLARQCTAYALNCEISGLGSNCGGADSLFNTCCAGTDGTCTASDVGGCISKLDCANNGGVFNTGTNQCETGTCSIGGAACNSDTLPCGIGAGECIPFANTCHTRDLPLNISDVETAGCPLQGPAGSEDECKAARKTPCTIQSCTNP
jgi:hypothetical protein